MNLLSLMILSLLATILWWSPTCDAQNNNSSGSSLSSLNTKGLLGDSADTKDFGKLPTNITSDTLTLNAKTRIFTYKGNVTVTQGDMTLVSKVVEGSYSEKNEIQKIVARGDVVITKAEIKATSQLATYDAIAGIITLTENPQLQQGESVLIADRIKVYARENRSQAEGNVRVTFVKKDMPSPAPASVSTATPAATTSTGPAASEAPVVAPTAKTAPAPKKTTTKEQKQGGSNTTRSKKSAKKTPAKKTPARKK
jgi:lipopolysaccharide export system protein LptA